MLTRITCTFMLVYLFQQNRTCALALTMDVTGRNLPSRIAARNWVFLETLDTNETRRNIAEIDGMLRANPGISF